MLEHAEREPGLVHLTEHLQRGAARVIKAVNGHGMPLCTANTREEATCIFLYHHPFRVIDHDRCATTTIERSDEAQDLLHVANTHAPSLGENEVEHTFLPPKFKGTFERWGLPLEHAAS